MPDVAASRNMFTTQLEVSSEIGPATRFAVAPSGTRLNGKRTVKSKSGSSAWPVCAWPVTVRTMFPGSSEKTAVLSVNVYEMWNVWTYGMEYDRVACNAGCARIESAIGCSIDFTYSAPTAIAKSSDPERNMLLTPAGSAVPSRKRAAIARTDWAPLNVLKAT